MPVTDLDFRWPIKDDYDIAMEDMEQSGLDPALRGGRLATAQSHILQIGGASHTSLYKVQDRRGRFWMIRCFCATDIASPGRMTMEYSVAPNEILERYKKICDFCEAHRSQAPALLPIKYVEQGIRVDYFKRDVLRQLTEYEKTEDLPFIRIPFVQGPSLGRFIASKCSEYREQQDRDALSLLADAWLEMIRSLEAVNMAHGDLDMTNVIVEFWEPGSQPVLKLIDYDNVWIPDLANYPQNEQGHEAFQHPAFFWSGSRPYNAEMDRFSALVIYISIKALAARPELYEEAGADESNRLLFAPADYMAEQKGTAQGCINELLALNIPGLEPYLSALRYSLHNQCMPSGLDAIRAGEIQPRSQRKPARPQRVEEPDPDPPVQINDKLSKPVEIWEIRRVDWNNAVYLKDKDAPLIEELPATPARPAAQWPPRPPVQPKPSAQPPQTRRVPPAQQPPSEPPVSQPVRKQPPQPVEPAKLRPAQQPVEWSPSQKSVLGQSQQPPVEPAISHLPTQAVPPQQERSILLPLPRNDREEVTIANPVTYVSGGMPESPATPAQQTPISLSSVVGCLTIILVIVVIIVLAYLVFHAFQTPQHAGSTFLIATVGKSTRTLIPAYAGRNMV